jgi:SAM-dependent methyltransferase
MDQETSLVRRLAASLPGLQIIRSAHKKLKRLGSTGEHWVRVVMNRETKKFVRSLSPETLSVLEISGYRWGEWMPFGRYQSVRYPAFDICQSILDETFDLIIAEQVFEHLQWPYRAGKNVYQMLAPGGHFLITTPFLIRVHRAPIDCSRWTETGMKHFLAECGFPLEHIRTGSWGNRACLRANFSRWRMYRPWLHSLKNEADFPVSVWAIARK